MNQVESDREVEYLLERKAKLLREIKQRNMKIKELEIELKVYSKLKGEENHG